VIQDVQTNRKSDDLLRPSGVTPERITVVAQEYFRKNRGKMPTMRILLDAIVERYQLQHRPSIDTVRNVIQEVNEIGKIKIILNGNSSYQDSDILKCISRLRKQLGENPSAREVYRKYKQLYPKKIATCSGINNFIKKRHEKLLKANSPSAKDWELAKYNPSTAAQKASEAFLSLKNKNNQQIFIPTLAEILKVSGGSQQALAVALKQCNQQRWEKNLNPLIHDSPRGHELKLINILKKFLAQDTENLVGFLENNNFYKNSDDGINAMRRYFEKLYKHGFSLLGAINTSTTSAQLKKYYDPNYLNLITLFCYAQTVITPKEFESAVDLAKRTSTLIINQNNWQADHLLQSKDNLQSRIILLTLLCSSGRIDSMFYRNLLENNNKFSKQNLIAEINSIISSCMEETPARSLLAHSFESNSSKLIPHEQIRDYQLCLEENLLNASSLKLSVPHLMIFQYGKHTKPNYAYELAKQSLQENQELRLTTNHQLDIKNQVVPARFCLLSKKSNSTSGKVRNFRNYDQIKNLVLDGFSEIFKQYRGLEQQLVIFVYLSPKNKPELSLFYSIIKACLNVNLAKTNTDTQTRIKPGNFSELQNIFKKYTDVQADKTDLVEIKNYDRVAAVNLQFFIYKRNK
jgi:hypothetical protein